MALRDFLAERAVVDRDGRRFVCRSPTVRTVLTLMTLFEEEVAAAYRMHNKDGLGENPIGALLRVFTAPPLGRIARVLSTCVKLRGGDSFDVETAIASDQKLACQLAGVVVTLCDIDELVGALGLEEAASAVDHSEQATDQPSNQEIAIVHLARQFGIRPDKICEWPYVTFVKTMEVLERLDSPTKEGSTSGEPAPYLTAENAPSGVVVDGADA